MTLKDKIEFILLSFMARWMQSLSADTVVKIGRFLGRVVYTFIPIRKSVVLQNLKLTFPHLEKKERRLIARGTFINFGQTFFEFMRTPNRSHEELRRRVVLHNTRVLKESYESGRGTLLMSGHFGNWEILACAVSMLGFPLVVIARKQRNPLVDAMINDYRRAGGIETTPLGMGVRAFLRALRSNKFIAMLADQDAHSEGVFIDFLNRPSATAPGPALLALKTGAEIIFCTSVLRKDGKYEVFFERIETKDVSGTTKENIRLLTQRHATKLEEKIRHWPDHWFWMHRRWKTSPPSEESSPSSPQ